MADFVPNYVSVDIETTGLDPDRHQILEFAAVAWTNDNHVSKLPWIGHLVKPDKNIVGSPYALNMNQHLLKRIADGEGVPLWTALYDFSIWLKNLGITKNNKVSIIGQNFGSFDLQFLKRAKWWPRDLISHRFFDISTIAASKDGMGSASLEIPEIPGDPHQALYDARVALHQAQQFFKKKSVFCLTRMGERGILGVYSDKDSAEAAAKGCFCPDEMEIEGHVLDNFQPGD